MNESTIKKIHWSFWLVALFALVWNTMGTMNFAMQVTGNYPAQLPDSHRAIIEGRPVWATAGFAIGVIAGVLGALLLLLKKRAAILLFMLSLIGIIVTMVHTAKVMSSGVAFNAFEVVMMMLLPVVVAMFLVWYSRLSESKHWIT